MSVNRREFVILTAAVAGGCVGPGGSGEGSIPLRPVTIDAGPVADYAADGVYDHFRNRGFFIVRSGERLVALSSTCTHRACRLKAEPDRSFYCKCHGSTFNPAGKVTEGPAKRDLPELPTSINANGRLIVLAIAG